MAIGERSALAAERLAIEHQVQRREFRVHLRRDRESQSHLPRYIRATRHALEDKLVFLLLEQLVPAVISFKQPPHAVARLMGAPVRPIYGRERGMTALSFAIHRPFTDVDLNDPSAKHGLGRTFCGD